MLARANSQAIQSLPAVSPPPLPAWARAVNAPETEAEAAFLAGAALARLDAVVRENPPWAGVWRQRLALSAAAANVRRAGRTEDEAALRDAFHLTGRAAIPDPQEGSCSPAGSSPPARPDSGGPRLPPPPRFSGFPATKRWKRPSRRPRPAPPAPGPRRSPPRALLHWRGAP